MNQLIFFYLQYKMCILLRIVPYLLFPPHSPLVVPVRVLAEWPTSRRKT